MNAKEARELAEKDTVPRMQVVYACIKEAAKLRKYNVSITFQGPCSYVIDQLKKDGYYVDVIVTMTDEHTLKISW